MNPNFDPNIGKATQLKPGQTPSAESKKAGWKKKADIKSKINLYLKKTVKELKEIQDDIKKRPDKYTMLDLSAISYVMNMSKNFKYMADHRDRNEGKATQEVRQVSECNIQLISKEEDNI